MEELSTIQKIVVIAPPFVFAVVFHEVAHGWIAEKLGDPTARKMGRLTLNPLRHIDLFGTIIMPLLLIILHSPVFGYAKPVPINPYNFKHPKRDMALSSLAGPGTNLLMALCFVFILRIALPALKNHIPQALWGWIATPVGLMSLYGVIINIVLAVLNMIPIPPLDGSRIVFWLLPEKAGMAYYRLEPYGFIILLALLYFNILGMIMIPIIGPIITLLVGEKIF